MAAVAAPGALMAARLNKRHDEEARNKIQASQLINRLSANAMGELKKEMTTGQIKSAEILLRKRLPDMSNVTMTGDSDNPLQLGVSVRFVGPAKGN